MMKKKTAVSSKNRLYHNLSHFIIEQTGRSDNQSSKEGEHNHIPINQKLDKSGHQRVINDMFQIPSNSIRMKNEILSHRKMKTDREYEVVKNCEEDLNQQQISQFWNKINHKKCQNSKKMQFFSRSYLDKIWDNNQSEDRKKILKNKTLDISKKTTNIILPPLQQYKLSKLKSTSVLSQISPHSILDQKIMAIKEKKMIIDQQKEKKLILKLQKIEERMVKYSLVQMKQKKAEEELNERLRNLRQYRKEKLKSPCAKKYGSPYLQNKKSNKKMNRCKTDISQGQVVKEEQKLLQIEFAKKKQKMKLIYLAPLSVRKSLSVKKVHKKTLNQQKIMRQKVSYSVLQKKSTVNTE